MPETWHPSVYLIVWRFHSFLTSSNLHWRKSAYAFHMNNISRNKYSIGNKLFKVIFNPGRKWSFKVRSTVFYALVCMRCTISVRQITPCQEKCTAAMLPFSDAQSVFNRFGHKPCSLIALKYKATGRIGFLFDLTTFNHKIFLENPLTPPCIGKPYYLILS